MAAWTTRNVRLLIFILGFIITILVNIVAQQHIKSIHQTQNARVRLGAEDGAGAAGGTAETQYPADWREAIRTLHKQHAGNVEKVRPKRERPAPAAVPTVRAQKLSDPTQAPGGSELHHLIGTALQHTRAGQQKMCIMEVGTADGKGTTVQLVKALKEYSQAHANREWQLTTYEGLPTLFQNARWEWQTVPTVRVVNQLVMSQSNLERFVFPHISGPPTAEWPGAPFYLNLYNGTAAQIAKGEMGAFIHSFPSCLLDLVLIDSTRFAHLGIIKTIMDREGLTDAETIWVIENDFWEGGGDERQILEKSLEFEFVAGDYPAGEQWPWIYFRIAPKHFD